MVSVILSKNVHMNESIPNAFRDSLNLAQYCHCHLKRQLIVVIIDSDIVEVKHVVKNAAHLHKCRICRYAVCYGFCDGSVIAIVEEYCRHFPTRRSPDYRMFSKVYIV